MFVQNHFRLELILFSLAIIFLIIFTSGCQTQSSKSAEATLSVQSWTSQDGNQVILRTPSQKRTDYFDNDVKQICFRFSVEGMWNPTNERGLLVSNDGKEQVGVLMLPREKLDKIDGKDLVDKAISLHLAYNTRRHKSSPIASSTDQIQTDSGTAVKWTGEWKISHKGQDFIAQVNRWFVEINQDWLAVITASHGSGGGEMAKKIIGSLQHTESPNCYWPIIKPILLSPCVECDS